MRHLGVALALALLLVVGSGQAAAADESTLYLAGQAEGLSALLAGDLGAAPAVLTPEGLGLTEPAQGFYPYFLGVPVRGYAPPALGLNGCGVFSINYCPFFSSAPFFSTCAGAGGTPIIIPLLSRTVSWHEQPRPVGAAALA
jgi:hypothetical protein